MDKIDGMRLWQKIMNANLGTKLIEAIRFMYETVKSFVHYKSMEFKPFVSKIDVKQGDPCKQHCVPFLPE